MTATTNGITVDTTYTGNHAVTFSGPSNGPSGTPPSYPATVNFAAGIGTANITLVAAQTVSLQATDGTRSGATSVTVVAAAASKLGFQRALLASEEHGTLEKFRPWAVPPEAWVAEIVKRLASRGAAALRP